MFKLQSEHLILDRYRLFGLLSVWPLSSAEKAVNECLAHMAELYPVALAQFAIAADTEVVIWLCHTGECQQRLDG